MDYNDAKLKMKSLGLPFDKSRFKRVVFHHKGETVKHYMLKSLLIYIFDEAKEPAFCECPIGKGIFDVFNLERMLCFEVETAPNSKTYAEKGAMLSGYEKQIDVVVIDTTKFSDDIRTAYMQLKEVVL
jgi:hypothetical protein